jgi:hypothetical protein
MSRKIVIFIVAGILVAGLLIAGVTAAATYADNGQGPAGGKLLARVAQILNIDQQKLADAFKQAGTELGQERMNSTFDKWVKDGKLTQDQANQYKAWLAAKPAGMFGPFMNQDRMDKLLKDGKVTQAQYDSWQRWMAQKPAFELPKPERPAGGAFPRRGPARGPVN